jgi:hypothetical protein
LSDFYKNEYTNTATDVIPILHQSSTKTITDTQGDEYRLNSNHRINTNKLEAEEEKVIIGKGCSEDTSNKK